MPLPRYRQPLFPLVLLLALWPMGVLAAQPTVGVDSGNLLRDLLPATLSSQPSTKHVLPTVPTESAESLVAPAQGQVNQVKIHVRSVRFHGVRAFPESVLLNLVADAQGKDLEFKQLQELSERITAYYRAQGYLLARAYLPAQKIADGSIEIAVTEGRLGRINIQASTPANAEQAKTYLADLHPGEAIQSATLERDLLLLGDLPGTQVQSSLQPGETVGTSHLDVRIKSARAINGNATLDNHGNRYTGEARASTRLNVANPFRFGDSLDLSATYSGHGLAYGRLAWQTPLGGRGLQVGVTGAVMSYALGQEFSALQASGHASDLTLYALQPLVRSRSLHVQAQSALDLKHFEDDAHGVGGTKQVQVISLGLSGSGPTPWGAHGQADLTFTLGHLQLGNIQAAALDASSYKANGVYAKIGFHGEYQHPFGQTTVVLKVNGQGASKNLDSSEKITLGGPQGVRAYAAGEGPVDDALLGSAELRRLWGERGTSQTQVKLFVDAARGLPAHATVPGDHVHARNLAGAGLGMEMTMPYDTRLQTSVAWRLIGAPSANLERMPRLWVLLSKGF